MSVVYVSALETGKTCLGLLAGTLAIDHVVTIDAVLAEQARVSGYADFRDMGVPTHHVRRYSMTAPEDRALIEALAPDLIIVNGWNRLLPRAILDVPRRGAVGLHGSAHALPAGRGRSPVTWALVDGATEFYLHLFHLDEGADSGDVIAMARFDITRAETCATLLAKVGIVSARLLAEHVPAILAGTASRTPQTGEPTYLRRRTPEEGRIDWALPVEAIENLVRGVTRPYAGAFGDVEYRGRRVRMRIWDAVAFSRAIAFDGPVGAIVHEIDGRPLVKCGDGLLLVREFSI
jgi:methionyl-tRNA formyltransferase